MHILPPLPTINLFVPEVTYDRLCVRGGGVVRTFGILLLAALIAVGGT